MSRTEDIQFGPVGVASPVRADRLEDDIHRWIACVGLCRGGQLPVYISLDAWLDMQEHARENTRTELGGVLIGTPCKDDAGRPFVFVQHTIRAKYYRSTQGSFTFTHDTWAHITEEKEERFPTLQIVGWYHTHPGWGIFLSPADLFICHNYFNNPLNVAIVLDPCHESHGVFCWQNQEMIRVSGFYLTALESRQRDLVALLRQLGPQTSQLCADELGGGNIPELVAAAAPLHATGNMPSWVRWWATAVLVVLAVQVFCTVGVGLFVWKLHHTVTTLAEQATLPATERDVATKSSSAGDLQETQAPSASADASSAAEPDVEQPDASDMGEPSEKRNAALDNPTVPPTSALQDSTSAEASNGVPASGDPPSTPQPTEPAPPASSTSPQSPATSEPNAAAPSDGDQGTRTFVKQINLVIDARGSRSLSWDHGDCLG